MSWLNTWLRGNKEKQGGGARRRERTTHLAVERLEDRLTPTGPASNVIVQNLGTGAISLLWDQQTTSVQLGANSSLQITGAVTGLNATLLDSGAYYQISTNAGFALVHADAGVTGVDLTVDTTDPLGYDFVGSGDISSIDLPGPSAEFGDSIINVHSRNDVGFISGPSDGLGALGGVFTFTNLAGSITGFDHIQEISAAAWLGNDPTDVISVNHGIDILNAEGVWANVDSALSFTASDPSSTITIGTGGIMQTMTLGNVGSFTDSGNIETLQIVSINGDLILNGAVIVNELALGQAQSANIQARQATATRLRALTDRNQQADGTWQFREIGLGAVTTFALGGSMASGQGNNGAIRLRIDGDFRANRIDNMVLYGALKAQNIVIDYIGQNWFVSGISVATQNPLYLEDPYAIYVSAMFLVGEFYDGSDVGQISTFTTARSIHAPIFTVHSGNLQYLTVGVADPGWGIPDPGTTTGFYGTINVQNGEIKHINVRDEIRQGAAVLDNVLISASGEIERISARRIGTSERRNVDLITAPSIGVIELPTAGLNISELNAKVVATSGNIESIQVTGGTIVGDITTERGDIKDIACRRLLANVSAHRDRENQQDNLYGNIWRINAGAIGLDGEGAQGNAFYHIQADNGIASITAGVIATNVRIFLQMGGSVIQNEGGGEFFELGGPMTVRVTDGAFFPRCVLFTYGLVDPTNPGNVNLNVPAAWKQDFGPYTELMSIEDRLNGVLRNISWSLTGPNLDTVIYAQGILFMQPNDGELLLLELFVAQFDGNPNGVDITRVIT